VGGTPEFGLILLERAGLSGGPVLVREFDAPESRRRGEKFDAHAPALVRIVAEIDHSTFLVLLRKGIGEDEEGSYLQILVEVEQSSMGIDNNRFAGVAKAAALLIPAREQHSNAHEDSRTASFAFIDGRGHDTSMVRQGLVCGQSCARFACLRGKLAVRTGCNSGPPCTARAGLLESGRRFRRADGAE
jgi:hypothetical protein